MGNRECSIDDFRKLIDDIHTTLGIHKKYFNLNMEISGDDTIIDNYKLEIFDGKEWVKLFEDCDLCNILISLRQVTDDLSYRSIGNIQKSSCTKRV